jgi:alkylation response protein AidB-like acyl-CoA dehydrogenase
MTQSQSTVEAGWGSGPGDNYEDLAAQFRPIFARIREGAVTRELNRTLPHEPIAWLKDARFGALRVPVEEGGFGATLPQLFALLAELSQADSNVTQALRAHFGFAEDIVNSHSQDRRDRWLPRLARGEIAGSAWTEIGEAKQAAFSTIVKRRADKAHVTGAKYYTTGSLFADWIDIGASGEDGQSLSAVVSRHAPGVNVIDDWDGFGQILTASGTTTFADAPVAVEDVVIDDDRFKYSAAFYQLVHLATLAGIGRAATDDVALAVKARRRSYSNAPSPRPAEDAQVLQIVGRIRGAAYSAGAIVLKSAEALQRAFDARFQHDAAAEEKANAIAELEVAQAQTVVTNLILDASTLLFDALGASATQRTSAFDRYWRNARTLSSHNPRIYKDRIIGDFAVNGTPPPYQWRIGQA